MSGFTTRRRIDRWLQQGAVVRRCRRHGRCGSRAD
jgi:hypothetical protein